MDGGINHRAMCVVTSLRSVRAITGLVCMYTYLYHLSRLTHFLPMTGRADFFFSFRLVHGVRP